MKALSLNSAERECPSCKATIKLIETKPERTKIEKPKWYGASERIGERACPICNVRIKIVFASMWPLIATTLLAISAAILYSNKPLIVLVAGFGMIVGGFLSAKTVRIEQSDKRPWWMIRITR